MWKTWVKFSHLKRKLYLWEKNCGWHFFWKRLNEHYKWSFYFRMYKMNISSYQHREPEAINYCYHEGDLRKPYYQKKSYLTYTIMLLPVTILDLHKIIICKLSTIYTPFLRKRNVCSHPKAKIYWNLSLIEHGKSVFRSKYLSQGKTAWNEITERRDFRKKIFSRGLPWSLTSGITEPCKFLI